MKIVDPEKILNQVSEDSSDITEEEISGGRIWNEEQQSTGRIWQSNRIQQICELINFWSPLSSFWQMFERITLSS